MTLQTAAATPLPLSTAGAQRMPANSRGPSFGAPI